MHIHDGNKSPLKFLGKAAVGVVRDSGKFSGHPWRIARSRSSFAIAQLSCYQVTLVFTSITCKRCVHACYNVCTLCIGLCSPCSPWPTVRRNGDWLKFTCKNSLQFSLHFDGCYIYCLAHLAEEHRPMSKLNIMMSIKKTDFLSLMYANVLVQTLQHILSGLKMMGALFVGPDFNWMASRLSCLDRSSWNATRDLLTAEISNVLWVFALPYWR